MHNGAMVGSILAGGAVLLLTLGGGALLVRELLRRSQLPVNDPRTILPKKADGAPTAPPFPNKSPDIPGPPPVPAAVSPPSALFTQQQIITACWILVRDGNTSGVEDIKRALDRIQPASAAYFVAAAAYANEAFLIDLKFRAEFVGAAKKAQAEYEKKMNEIDAGLGTAATLINVIPVVGQVVSGLIGIGIAIKRLFQELLGPVTSRATDDNEKIYRDWEGSNCRRGLHLADSANPSQRQLIRAVDSDLVAGLLPEVPNAYQFEFTPTLEGFQKAALSMGLYSAEFIGQTYGIKSVWNVSPADGVPKTAFEIAHYVTGYAVGQGGEPYAESKLWGQIGYLDAKEGKPSRVGGDLSLWAEDKIAKLTAAK